MSAIKTFEAGVLRQEHQLHGANWTFPLFSDDQVGLYRVLMRILRVPISSSLAMEEQDDIGVLLERARLPEVSKTRGLFLRYAGELGERHHWDLEFTGEGFERTTDVGDLFVPWDIHVFVANERNIVNVQDLNVVLALHPPGLGTQIEQFHVGLSLIHI